MLNQLTPLSTEYCNGAEPPEAVIMMDPLLLPHAALVTDTFVMAGLGFNPILMLPSVDEQPFSVQLTKYVVGEVGITVILDVVSPVLHNNEPEQPDAVSVVDWPEQTVKLVAVTEGAAGTGLTVMVIELLGAEVQPKSVQVAE